MRDPALIIFDFDGVVVDNEFIANRALAEYLTELGKPTMLDDSMRLFMGKRRSDVVAAVEQ
jgi:beta-phosphoglucomutase-like phosphatase (HAD superfamily)